MSEEPTQTVSALVTARRAAIREDLAVYLRDLEAEAQRVRNFLGIGPAHDRRHATGTGADARAVALMRASPAGLWDARRLLNALLRDGWRTTSRSPLNSMNAVLSRLNHSGVVERERHGYYRVNETTRAH